MGGRAGRFVRLAWCDKLLFIEAFFFQFVAGLVLKVVPFRRIPRLFAKANSREHGAGSTEQGAQGAEPTDDDSQPISHASNLQQIRIAIQRSARLSPWKNKCFVSSLAGKWMLNRRQTDSQLSLGLAKDHNGKVIAHAWLKSGDFEIIEKSGDYTALYTF